jgi:hypothetical protein
MKNAWIYCQLGLLALTYSLDHFDSDVERNGHNVLEHNQTRAKGQR